MSARESRIADGMAAVDAGLQRTIAATLAAEWAESAMVNAEMLAHLEPVSVDHFGVLFEVFWTDACCTPPFREWHNCRPAHYTYWHEGARKNREYLLALLVDAALADAGNVEAAMEVGS